MVLGLAGRPAAPLRLRSPFWHREVEGSPGISSVVFLVRSRVWGFVVSWVAAALLPVRVPEF